MSEEGGRQFSKFIFRFAIPALAALGLLFFARSKSEQEETAPPDPQSQSHLGDDTSVSPAATPDVRDKTLPTRSL